MDWYLPEPTLRAKLIKWVGKGEVDRPVYQYLKSKVAKFTVNTSFNRGGVFVAKALLTPEQLTKYNEKGNRKRGGKKGRNSEREEQ